MTHSLMLTHWLGGGQPNGSRTMTFSGDPAYIRRKALAWIDAALAGDHEDEADEDDDDLRVRLSDVPMALWEDLTDAAA